MLLALVLSSVTADAATDIGTEKKFGIGVATGAPLLSLTGKYYLTERSGIVGYAGTTFFSHALRVGYQAPIHTWGENWSWGQLPLYWHVDAEVGVWTYLGSGIQVGAGGGVGLALQFAKVPAELFTEVGIGVYPLNYCNISYPGIPGSTRALCIVAPFGAAGARWYF